MTSEHMLLPPLSPRSGAVKVSPLLVLLTLLQEWLGQVRLQRPTIPNSRWLQIATACTFLMLHCGCLLRAVLTLGPKLTAATLWVIAGNCGKGQELWRV